MSESFAYKINPNCKIWNDCLEFGMKERTWPRQAINLRKA